MCARKKVLGSRGLSGFSGKEDKTVSVASSAGDDIVPLIHIVCPLETHSSGGRSYEVKKPVQLHVLDDGGPDFKARFPPELFEVVKGLRAGGERKINIHFENEGHRAEFIFQTSRMMGFYRRGRLLCIDACKFDEFAARQG
ncbi:MAG: hypothetical protein ABH834_07635 [Candidatus Altiarchaeota archaeon]